MKLGISEGEHATVGGDEPIAIVGRLQLIPTTGASSRTPGQTVELGVAEGEHAAVSGDERIALAV